MDKKPKKKELVQHPTVFPETVEYDENGKPIIPEGYVSTYHRRKGLMKVRVTSSKQEA